MYNNEIVSVIIPVYNCEKFIGETIESALSQTYKDIEIVLVDDASTDQSVNIIEEYKNKYPDKIIYHKQKKNMGVAVARNTALDIAKGRYVAFLDSDDIWKKEKTTRELVLMKEKNAPISYTAIEMIDESGNVIKKYIKVNEQVNYKLLLHNTMIATSTVIADRNILGDFRMPIRRGGQDYATWLKLLRGGAVFVGIDEVFTQYRVRSGSLSSNKLNSIRQVWEIQTQDEGISKMIVVWHVLCFSFNALKKYLM